MPVKKIGVVVVTRNNAGMLKFLLGDILKQTLAPDEVIVIDNASTDATPSVIRAYFPKIRYVRLDANQGSAGGYHEGIKLAVEKNDLIWTLDDDLSLDKDALKALVETIERLAKTEKVGAVRSCETHTYKPGASQKNTSFAWRATLIRREAVRDAGLPNKDYFLYGEDYEYSLRMVKNGYSIFCEPESRVVEKRSVDMIKFPALGVKLEAYRETFRLYYAARNQTNIFLSHRDFLGLFLTFAYAIKAIFFFTVFKRKKWIGHIKAILEGIRDGLSGRLGINRQYLPEE